MAAPVITITSGQGFWSAKAGMPAARSGLAAASPGNGRVYAVGGGWNPAYNTNYEYDPATNTWSTKASMPTARGNLAAASPGDGKVYVIGGGRYADPGPCELAANEVYDPTANTWSTKASMPTARYSLAAASPGDGKIYVLGGEYDIWHGGTLVSKNEVYNSVTGTWSIGAAMSWVRKGLAVTSLKNGKVYAIGGYNSTYLALNEEYDPATNTWSTKASMPTARAYLAAVSLDNGNIYAIGGNGPKTTNEEYNPLTNTWTTRTAMPTARSGLAAASIGDGKIYAIGGNDGSNNRSINEEYSIGSPLLTKISDEPGKNQCVLTFRVDQDIVEWCIRVGGNSYDTGYLAESGGAASADTDITAYIDWNEGLVEGENRVNIYAKNAAGEWTPYDQA